MLRRKKLAQSQDDLVMAGMAGMVAFSDNQFFSGRQWRGNAAAVTGIMSINAMPLAYLHGKSYSVLSPLLESAEFVGEVEKHQEKYDRWKKAFGAVRDVFLTNGVRYLFIKSPSLFPYTSGNLDIMVREQDFARAGHLLEQIGFIELRNIREPHKFLYKQFDCGKEVVAIHLHGRVFWGATFIDSDSAWSRTDGQRLFDDVVFPLSAEDCMLTTFAHSFYENSGIRLLDLCIVKHLVDNEKVEWQYLSSTSRAGKWEDGFHLSVLAYARLHQAIFGGLLFPEDVLKHARQYTDQRILLRKAVRRLEHDKLTMPFYLPLVTSKLLGYKKIAQSTEFGGLHRRILQLGKLLFEVLFIHILKVNPQRGMLIALSGVDGSGKTTYAHALMEAFRGCGLDAHYIWTRVGSQKGFQALAKWLTRRSARSSNSGDHPGTSERFQKTKGLFSNRWRYIAWKTVNMVDLCVFYNLTLRVKLLRRQVVVCDRFIPDMFVDLHVYDQGRPSQICLKLLSWFLPRPAVSILLTAPEDLALRRSSDPECMDSLQAQTHLYGQIQERLKLTVVDNGYREFQDVCDDLVSHMLQAYYGKKCVWFGWEQDK